MDAYWAVAQTVPKMEHVVRREIERANRGAFLPTCARFWKVDGREYSKERPLLTGYVFFITAGNDWAGIPDIPGVYRVPANPNNTPMRATSQEIIRLMISHAAGEHNETLPPRYTKYYRSEQQRTKRANSRKPRPGKRIRNRHVFSNQEQSVMSRANGEVVIGLSAGPTQI